VVAGVALGSGADATGEHGARSVLAYEDVIHPRHNNKIILLKAQNPGERNLALSAVTKRITVFNRTPLISQLRPLSFQFLILSV
jgi:hypothetical protein